MVQPFRGLTTRGALDRSGDLHSEETRNRDAETTAAHFWLPHTGALETSGRLARSDLDRLRALTPSKLDACQPIAATNSKPSRR